MLGLLGAASTHVINSKWWVLDLTCAFSPNVLLTGYGMSETFHTQLLSDRKK